LFDLSKNIDYISITGYLYSFKNLPMRKRKIFAITITFVTIFTIILYPRSAMAAAFTEFSIRPSRIESSITDVNFLIKADAVSSATEDGVRVTFDTGYAVDATNTNITVSTTGLTNWDSECTNAWPGIGSNASAVNGQVVDFNSTTLIQGQTYCFIITAGIDNPGSTGNYSVSVATRETSSDVDTGAMTVPIVDDDEIVISASTQAFVRCDVTTTSGADNAIDLGTLEYGTVDSSTDDVQIQGGTNAAEGMVWYYRNSDSNVGLYSTTGTDTLDAPDSGNGGSEGTISATTADCAPATPCYGIYYNGTTTSDSGSFTADSDFTGLTVTTGAGPMRDEIYGEEIGNSGSSECSEVTADFNVNATAGQNSALASDFTDTLIFTCKADI